MDRKFVLRLMPGKRFPACRNANYISGSGNGKRLKKTVNPRTINLPAPGSPRCPVVVGSPGPFPHWTSRNVITFHSVFSVETLVEGVSSMVEGGIKDWEKHFPKFHEFILMYNVES